MSRRRLTRKPLRSARAATAPNRSGWRGTISRRVASRPGVWRMRRRTSSSVCSSSSCVLPATISGASVAVRPKRCVQVAGLGLGDVFLHDVLVVLDVAADGEFARRRAQALRAVGVFLATSSASGCSSGRRCPSAGSQLVVRERLRGQAPVDHDDGDAALLGLVQDIRPDFGVDGDEQRRLDPVQDALGDAGQVNGEVERVAGAVPLEPLLRDRLAGLGDGGEDEPRLGNRWTARGRAAGR